MVARNPATGKAAPINPLLCETDEEMEIQRTGMERKRQRLLLKEQDLFVTPPNQTG